MITRYNESGRMITCNPDQIAQMEEIGYKLKEIPNKTIKVHKKTEVYKSTESTNITANKTSSTIQNTRLTKKAPDIVL